MRSRSLTSFCQEYHYGLVHVAVALYGVATADAVLSFCSISVCGPISLFSSVDRFESLSLVQDYLDGCRDDWVEAPCRLGLKMAT